MVSPKYLPYLSLHEQISEDKVILFKGAYIIPQI